MAANPDICVMIQSMRSLPPPPIPPFRCHGAVLAAGLGSRLRPLTTLRPKPLVPLFDRPLIGFALDALASAGVEAIGVNTCHLGIQVHEALAEARRRDPALPPLIAVDEDQLQGTGGGLRGIAAALRGQDAEVGATVVVNGDALFSFSLPPVLAAHGQRRPVATLALRRVPIGSPFARVAVDEAGEVWRIAEVERPGSPRGPLKIGAFTGVQVVEGAIIDALPIAGACDVFRSAYRDLLRRGASIRGVFVDDLEGAPYWLDVGTPERYLEAHEAIFEGRVQARGLVEPDGEGRRIDARAEIQPGAEIHGPCWIGPGAVIEAGALVGPMTTVGAGARVGSGVRLRSAVVWPGVQVMAGAHVGRTLIEDQGPS